MSASTAACHARFAAACAISELVNEQPAGAVAETWGTSGIFKGGKPRIRYVELAFNICGVPYLDVSGCSDL